MQKGEILSMQGLVEEEDLKMLPKRILLND